MSTGAGHPLSHTIAGGIAKTVMEYNQLLRNKYEIQQAIRRLTLHAMSVVHLIWNSPVPWIGPEVFQNYDVHDDSPWLWTNLYTSGVSSPINIMRADLGELLTRGHVPHAQVAWLCVQGFNFELPHSFTHAVNLQYFNRRLAHYVLAYSVSDMPLDLAFLGEYLNFIFDAGLQLFHALPLAENKILNKRQQIILDMPEVRRATQEEQIDSFCSWHRCNQVNPFSL